MKNLLLFSFSVFMLFALVSCGTNKRLTERSIYFKNLNDSLLRQASRPYEPIFQKGDLLNISVFTANEASGKLLNQQSGNSTAGSASATAGYLVGIDGNITMPLIGTVKAEGVTKLELINTLTQKIRATVVNDAIVSITLQNYKVTVLGEVLRPSSYVIPNERVSVIDIIGMAGDLTPFGRRDNIKIIREDGDKREVGTLNLNDGNIFQSPYFYLRQNDIVYVEMNDRKMGNIDQTNTRTFSIVVGIISALSIVIVTISRF